MASSPPLPPPSSPPPPVQFRKKSFQEITDDILQQITRGIAKERHTFDSQLTKYRLQYENVRDILLVEGLKNDDTHEFAKGRDYALGNDGALEWLASGDRPDPHTEFMISYAFGEPSKLTDINAGSVLRTIVEAISREMEFLYEQLDHVYKSGFIDTASGKSLDLVAAILGPKFARKPPTHAVGEVTFWRKTHPPEIKVEGEPIIYEGFDTYDLKVTPVKRILEVTGNSKESKSYSFKQDEDFVLENDSSIRWLKAGRHPDLRSTFLVKYSAHQQILVPEGTQVSTSPSASSSPIIYVTTKVGLLEKKKNSGLWEATVDARATVPGKAGNVAAGSITLMPTPPVNVEFVINRANMANGEDYENDDDFRERVKRALEVTSKATTGSITAAIEDLGGIPLMKEDDKVPGLVKLVVEGGDEVAIRRAIEETRGAGIKIEFSRPRHILVDVYATVIVDKPNYHHNQKNNNSSLKQGNDDNDDDAGYEELKAEIATRIKDFFSSLEIGEDVGVNRVVSRILGTQGVYDVARFEMKASYEDGRLASSVDDGLDRISIDEFEKAYLNQIKVTVMGAAAHE